jgi:hypothetical protein
VGELLRGHAALSQWFDRADRTGTDIATNSVVTIDGVHGTQRSVVLRLAGPLEGGAMIASVHPVFDDVVCERVRWYFCRRRVMAGIAGAPDQLGPVGRTRHLTERHLITGRRQRRIEP